ncbi:MAG: hypothetical protein AAGI07_12290, partial [Bacteroidota bacterium]
MFSLDSIDFSYKEMGILKKSQTSVWMRRFRSAFYFYEMKSYLEINIYRSLFDSEQFTVAWKDIQSFDLTDLNKEEEVLINNILGIELTFKTAPSVDITFVASKIFELIHSIKGYEKLLFLRELLQEKSRIRSFKGVVKSVNKPNIKFLEKEIDTEKEYSFFV